MRINALFARLRKPEKSVVNACAEESCRGDYTGRRATNKTSEKSADPQGSERTLKPAISSALVQSDTLLNSRWVRADRVNPILVDTFS